MSDTQLSPASEADKRARTENSIDHEQLVHWLHETGRRYLVFRAEDLVRSLTLEGIGTLMDVIAAYRGYRESVPADRMESFTGEVHGQTVVEPAYKNEILEADEMRELVADLQNQIADLERSAAQAT